jgi:sec-independent protein translocase protein TatC
VKLPFKIRRSEPVSPEAEMSLVAHLGELRTRIIRSFMAVIAAAIVIWIYREPLFDFLSEPYCDLRPEDDCSFIVTDPLGEFNVSLTLAGYGGLIVALPVIFYQLGRFVMPGLYPREKRWLLPFLLSSVILLVGGITVGYLFLPRALEVLSGIGSERFESFFTPNNYLSFFIKMVLAFGLAFELPLVLVFLQMIGVMETQTLKKNRRIAVVAVVILAAVITPTGDPFTLLVLAVPMYFFFEIAIIIGGRLTRNRPSVT